MAQSDPDMDDHVDPVVNQLELDLRDLHAALEFLEYHGHMTAAGVIGKEARNTAQLIGKWKAVHTARLPL